MSRFLKPSLLAGGLALVGLPAIAQAPDAPLSEVVVTTRLPQALIDVPGAKVIDRAEIDRRNAVFAADVLATVPGVAVSENGPFGGVTSLRLRGAPSDKTLVLIDGVSVNDPSQPAGGFDFASLDLADVERIEILPGPQGSLWGSDAIGGVVNILTRETNGVHGQAEYGSFETWRAAGAAGFADDKRALGITASGLRTDGISKADARDGNTEKDGFKNFTVGVNGRISPTEGVKLEARLRYNRARTDYDGFGGPSGVIDENDTSDVKTGSGFVRATVSGPLGFTHSFTVDASTVERSYGGPFPFEAKGGRTNYRWLAQQAPTRQLALALGLEHEDQHENTGDGRQEAGNTAGFAVLRWAPTDRLTATASLRHDDPDHYQGRTTARVSGRASLGQGFSLAASFGQGFKTPSLFQTGYPCFECTVPGPNPSLKPERAEGYDATLSWDEASGRASVSITAYRLRIRDRIDYSFPIGYVNIARARSTGIEAQGRASLGAGFAARASYAWTDAKDSLTGAQLRVPRHAGSAGVDWSSPKLTVAVLARAQSGAPDSFGRLKSFAVAEASAAYALSKGMKLTLRVENLLDTHYQQAFGYGEPGRSAYFGVSMAY